MRRIFATGALCVTLLAAISGQALAAEPIHFSFTDSWTVEHACGIVEETTLSAHGVAIFDADGEWLRDVVKFTVSGSFTNIATGDVYTGLSNQSVTFSPDSVTLNGQGIFLRGPGGVLFYDVGRLVAEDVGGTTLSATPKVLAYDDTAGFEALEAALCEALG